MCYEGRRTDMNALTRNAIRVAVFALALGLFIPAAMAHITSGNRIRIFDGNLEAIAPDYERTPNSDYTTTTVSVHHHYFNHPGVTACPGAGDQYRIRIVRERTLQPDDFYAFRTMGCEASGDTDWDVGQTGNWHTDMQKESGATTTPWTVEGHLHYPN
jgi:hypothetical protein